MIRRLQLFLGSVAAALWLVSYWAYTMYPDAPGDWWILLSATTFMGAVVATAAIVVTQAIYIADPKAFEDKE